MTPSTPTPNPRSLMRRTLSLLAALAALAAAACAARSADVPAAAPAQDGGTFVVRQGADTLVVERFTRTATTLHGEMAIRRNLVLTYDQTLGPDAATTGIETRATRPGADSVLQRFSATIRADTLAGTTQEGDSTRQVRVPVRPGTVLYFNPSPAMLEQAVRRARAIGGTRVEVPVHVLSGRGAGATSVITFVGADSATATLGQAETRLAVDREGRILGGSIPSSGVVIERLPAARP